MALEQIGLNLIVSGVSQFARNMGYVNSSYGRYINQLSKVERSLMSVASAEARKGTAMVNEANRISTNVAPKYAKYTREVDRLTKALVDVRAIVQSVSTQPLLDANDLALLQTLGAKIPILEAELKSAQEQVMGFGGALDYAFQIGTEGTDRMNAGLSDMQQIASAFDTSGMGFMDFVKQLGSVMTGGFGQNMITGLSMQFPAAASGLAKLVPQLAAIALVLDVVKLALDAVVMGFKIFVGTIKLVWNVVTSTIKFIGNLIKSLWDLGRTIVDNVVTGLRSLFQGFMSLFGISGVTNIFDAIGQSLRRIWEFTVGNLLADGIRKIGQSIADVGKEAVQAAVDFQALNIRLSGLLARENLELGFATTINEGLEQTKDLLPQIINDLQTLAVTTPFRMSTVSDTFTLASAYGFAHENAMELTKSTSLFATGMGLTDEAMRKIIENFGQMKAQGKIAGTELRDLARGAFVPVNEIFGMLGEKYNISMEEARAWSRSGKISVDEFIDAFMVMANTQFAGATDRMKESWNVAISNVHDFIQAVVGMRILGPVVSRVSRVISNLVEELFTPEILAVAERVGQTFGNITKFLLEFVGALSASGLGGMFDKLMSPLKLFGQFMESIFADDFQYWADESGELANSVIISMTDIMDTLGVSSVKSNAFIKGIFGIRDAFSLMFQNLRSGKKTFSELWNETVIPTFLKVKDIFDTEIMPVFRDIWDKYVAPEIETFKDKFKNEWMPDLVNSAIQTAKDIVEGFKEYLPKIVGFIETEVIPFIKEAWNLIKPEIGSAITDVLDDLETNYGDGAFISSLIDVLEDLNGWLFEDTGISPLKDSLKGVREEAEKLIEKVGTSIGDWAEENYPGVLNLNDSLKKVSDSLLRVGDSFTAFDVDMGEGNSIFSLNGLAQLSSGLIDFAGKVSQFVLFPFTVMASAAINIFTVLKVGIMEFGRDIADVGAGITAVFDDISKGKPATESLLALGQTLSGFGKGVSSTAMEEGFKAQFEFLQAGTTFLPNMNSFFSGASSQLEDGALSGFTDSISGLMDSSLSGAISGENPLVNMVRGWFEQLNDASYLEETLGVGPDSGLGMNMMDKLIPLMFGGEGTAPSEALIPTGQQLGAGLIAGINDGVSAQVGINVEQMTTYVSDMNQPVRDGAQRFRDAGANLMQGVTNGLNSKVASAVEAARAAALAITNAFNDAMGIQSPSKVFQESGINIMAGLEKGLRSGITLIDGWMDDVSDYLGEPEPKPKKKRRKKSPVTAPSTSSVISSLPNYLIPGLSTNALAQSFYGPLYFNLNADAQVTDFLANQVSQI